MATKRPRFVIRDCEECSEDRVFKNGKCVFNQNLGFAYSVCELVEVLNEQGTFQDFFNELIQVKIWYCQAMYKETENCDYLIQEECLKELREESYTKSSVYIYSTFLQKYLEKQQK